MARTRVVGHSQELQSGELLGKVAVIDTAYDTIPKRNRPERADRGWEWVGWRAGVELSRQILLRNWGFRENRGPGSACFIWKIILLDGRTRSAQKVVEVAFFLSILERTVTNAHVPSN